MWLLPTPAVQEERLARRDLPDGVGTLYRLLAREIAEEVAAAGRPVVAVDGWLGVDAAVAAVERVLGTALHDGPRATTAAERSALLRDANAAIVTQYRGFAARPWAPPDALAAVCAFACECGRVDCVAEVDLPVGTVSAPVLAAGH